MSYTVLARKYRPQTFDEVYSQEHITKILRNSIELKRTAHAYLFTGPRGVGKTSLARIYAKSLNCVHGPTANPCNICENCVEITKGISSDVIEIDGASNTGVDDVREIQKELMYTNHKSQYKIYIIDEVHMLSKNAFNALLKTLEEPPENVIFIFATTEPHKVLPTIISRCQRYDFKRIPVNAIVKNVMSICKDERIEIEEEAAFTIAKKADGGMRDALSLLDQVISYGNEKITHEEILRIFGIVHTDIYNSLIHAILKRKPADMITLLHQMLEKGTDLQEFLSGLLDYIRDILLTKLNVDSADISKNITSELLELGNCFEENTLLYLMSYLIKAKNDLKVSNEPLLLAELAFIKMSKITQMEAVDTIIGKLSSVKSVHIKDDAQVYEPVEKLHKSVSDMKQKIVQEVKLEPPKIEKLTKEILTSEWRVLTDKIKTKKPLLINYFLINKLTDVQNNHIIMTFDTDLAYKQVMASRSELISVISNHFHLQISMEFLLEKKEKDIVIKNPTLQDIEKENPDLAEFIKITESMISQI